MLHPTPEAPSPVHAIVGGGEMGALARTVDWASTPIGAVAEWPQSLRTAVSICLASRFPMLIWWGPERIQIYNDAYRPVLGAKHPASMGQRGRECWAEIWGVIGPLYDHVHETGEGTWSEDLLLVMDRHGYDEETYFTFSYSAMRDESGGVGGVLVTCVETTRRVLGERRLRTLRELGERAGHAETVAAACALAAATLADNPLDVPFALVYRVEEGDGGAARLLGVSGVEPGTDMAPRELHPGDDAAAWPLRAAAEDAARVVVDDLPARFGALPSGPWGHPVETAAVLPITRPGQAVPAGFLVAGISPARALDADYLSFLELVAGHIATGIASAQAHEEELRRREALAALEREREQLRALFEKAPSFIAVTRGPEHVFERTNPRYDALVGHRPMVGHTVREALPELEGQGFFDLLDRVFHTGEPYVGNESRILLRRGGGEWEERFLNFLYQPMREGGDRPTGIFVHGVDVTELVQARQLAQTANAAKAQFLATMSHELRTPLNAIGGYTQLLQLGIHGPVTPEQTDALHRIQRSQQHLLGLINSVLNYAKLEAGRVQYDVAELPLAEAMAGVDALATPLAGAKGVRLEVVPPAPGLRVAADAEKLRQIVLNLLSNAVKFTPAGGAITVWCEPLPPAGDGGAVVALHVGDTGRGIPPEQLERVFDPFVQVGRDLTSVDEGTGLGLAISRDLARGMGGDLVAESTVGAGSTFTLHLPAPGPA